MLMELQTREQILKLSRYDLESNYRKPFVVGFGGVGAEKKIRENVNCNRFKALKF